WHGRKHPQGHQIRIGLGRSLQKPCRPKPTRFAIVQRAFAPIAPVIPGVVESSGGRWTGYTSANRRAGGYGSLRILDRHSDPSLVSEVLHQARAVQLWELTDTAPTRKALCYNSLTIRLMPPESPVIYAAWAIPLSPMTCGKELPPQSEGWGTDCRR